jgi:hypothetical protein
MASKKKGVHRFGDFLNKDNDDEEEQSGQGGGGGSGSGGGVPKGPKKDYVGAWCNFSPTSSPKQTWRRGCH